MLEHNSKHIKDPLKILDTLDSVIKKLSGQCRPKPTADEVLQLNEITKAIERLKNSGASVPDEIRKLKIELIAVVTQHENVIRILQSIELRLAHTITNLRAKIKQLSGPNLNKTKPRKRYVKRTSPALLRKEISKALRDLGGAAKRSDVIDRIRVNMDGKFKPCDIERNSQGIMNWEKWVVSLRSKMIKEGVLKSGLNNRLWELRRK